MEQDSILPDLPGIELQHLLADPDPTRMRARRNTQSRNDPIEDETLDDWLLEAARPTAAGGPPVELEHSIQNIDRTVGARLAGEIARRYGDSGLPTESIRATFTGSAGQSFGAFCISGVHLTLIGEANDYVGKGMAGGEIVIRLPASAHWASQDNYIAGNTLLYGATGGSFFAAGRVGERFAVRNCGATAVVEGIGDHGCEYMTSGTIVILGWTGRNFGAGMTGGVAYVYDREQKFGQRINTQLVRAERIERADDGERVNALTVQHADKTGSAWSRGLLSNWEETLASFWKVMPK